MKKETLGIILVLCTAVISGIAIPANKIFLVKMDPAVFTAVRAIIIGVAFLALAWWSNRGTKKLFKTDWKYLAGIAIIGGALAFLLYFNGLQLTTAGRGAFLHKTLPLFTAILAFVFLREKLTLKYVGAMLAMFVGVYLIYSTSLAPNELWANPQLGDLLILGAAFLWAVENVIAKKAMSNGENNWIISVSRMLFGGLILFGVVILMGKTGALLALTNQQLTNIGISTLLLFCYVLTYYWALKLIDVSKAAALLLIAPVISLVIGITFLGEPAPIVQLFGSFVILLGAFFLIRVKAKEHGI
jgi:drug/metabolite transporter (DMT)-like permease